MYMEIFPHDLIFSCVYMNIDGLYQLFLVGWILKGIRGRF